MLKGEGCDDSGIVTVVTMSLLPRYTVPIFFFMFLCLLFSTFVDRYTWGDERDARAHFLVLKHARSDGVPIICPFLS